MTIASKKMSALTIVMMTLAMCLTVVQGYGSCRCSFGLVWDNGSYGASTSIQYFTLKPNSGTYTYHTKGWLSTYQWTTGIVCDESQRTLQYRFQAYSPSVASGSRSTGFITVNTANVQSGAWSTIYSYIYLNDGGYGCGYSYWLKLRFFMCDATQATFTDNSEDTYNVGVGSPSATRSISFDTPTDDSSYDRCSHLIYDFENIPATDDTIYRSSYSYSSYFGAKIGTAGSFQFKIKGYMFTGSSATAISKELVWTSGVKTLNIACSSSSLPDVQPDRTSTTVDHATNELIIAVVPISADCPVHSVAVVGTSSSTGLPLLNTITHVSGNNYKVTVDLSKRGYYYYKINTTSGSSDGSNLATQQLGTYFFSVNCDPQALTIQDGFTSTNATLKVGDTQPYWVFPDFTSSNADCGAVHDTYELVDPTTLGTISGLTLEDLTGNSTGTNQIKVLDINKKASYSFKVKSNVTDGGDTDFYYSSTFTIIVQCANDSTGITDQPPHEFVFEVGKVGADTFEIPKYVSPTDCAVLSQEFVQDVNQTAYPLGLVDPPVLSNDVYTFKVFNMSQQGSYSFRIKAISEGNFTFYSVEKTVTVACVATSAVITDNITRSQNYEVSDAIDTYRFYKFTTDVDCSPYKYEVFNSTGQKPEGLVSNVAQQVPGTDWYQVKISNMLIEQSIVFTIKGSILGGGIHVTENVTLTVVCGQNSGVVMYDMIANYTLHVSINDTLQVPGLTKQLPSCPITHQEIVALTQNGTAYQYPPGFAVNSTWNQTSNNLTVVVDDNWINGTYNFSIMATMRGGVVYSPYSNVSVICGPDSVNITDDPTREQLVKYQNNLLPYRFKPFVPTNPNCPVNRTYLVTETGGFPQGISATSPTYNEGTGFFEVDVENPSLAGNFPFYIEVQLEGNYTFRTKKEKKIQILEIPKEDNPLNMAPAFDSTLIDQTIVLKEGEEYKDENQYLYAYSPQAIDIEGNVVSIELLDNGGLKQVEFEVDSSNDTFIIKIDLASLSEKDAGNYDVKIRLKDDKTNLQNDYTMKFMIEWEEKEEIVEEEESAFVFQGVDMAARDQEIQEEQEVEDKEDSEKVEEVYKLPVKLRLSSISQDGEVGIKFNQELKVPDLDNLILTYSSSPEGEDESNRLLQEIDKDEGKQNIKDIVELTIDTSNYKVSLQEWTPQGMTFKIDFDDPLGISKNGQKNALSFQVRKNSYFVSKKHGLSIDDENKALKMVKTIPIQLPTGISAKELEEQAQSQENSVKAILIVQFLIMSLLKGQKDKLWAMLLALQVIVYLPIYSVDYPGNVQIFLKAIRKIAEFKVIGPEELFDFFNIQNPLKKTGLSKEEQLEQEAYAAAGFESFDMLENMAYYMLIGGIGLFVLLVLVVLSTIKKLKERIIAELVKVKDQFMYNGIIRSLNLTYLKQFVNFGLATSVVAYTNEEVQVNVSSTVTVLIGINLILYPLWSTWFLYTNRNNLDQKEIKAKYLSLYLGLRTNSVYYLVYPLIFMLRRMLFVLFALANSDMPYLQVQCLVFTVTLYMIYLGQHKPHDRRKSQNLELFNEFMILFICYHMFCYTPWVDDRLQYDIGNSMIAGVIFLMLTNLVVMFSDIKRPLILKYRFKLRMKKIKELKEKRRNDPLHKYKKAKIGMEKHIAERYKAFEPKQEIPTDTKVEKKIRPKFKKKKKKTKTKNQEVSEMQQLDIDDDWELRRQIAEQARQAQLIREKEEAEADRKLAQLLEREKERGKVKLGDKFKQTRASKGVARRSRAKAQNMKTIIEEESVIADEED